MEVINAQNSVIDLRLLASSCNGMKRTALVKLHEQLEYNKLKLFCLHLQNAINYFFYLKVIIILNSGHQ